jgi:hypothetical protein
MYGCQADVIYPCLRYARELVLGIRPGSDVRIDTRTTSDTNQDADQGLACLRTTLFRDSTSSVRISFTGGNQHGSWTVTICP